MCAPVLIFLFLLFLSTKVKLPLVLSQLLFCFDSYRSLTHLGKSAQSVWIKNTNITLTLISYWFNTLCLCCASGNICNQSICVICQLFVIYQSICVIAAFPQFPDPCDIRMNEANLMKFRICCPNLWHQDLNFLVSGSFSKEQILFSRYPTQFHQTPQSSMWEKYLNPLSFDQTLAFLFHWV